MPQFLNKCAFLLAGHAFIRHFRKEVPNTKNDIKYNQGSKNRKKEPIEIEMLLSGKRFLFLAMRCSYLEKIKTSQNTGIYFLDIDLGSNINEMKLAQH